MRSADVVAVFVKAPVAGRVKTRLAAEVGVHHAAEIYRSLGRRVVATCLGRRYETVVWFAPAGARQAVRQWLGGLDVDSFRAQVSGALGVRLTAAFGQHFQEGASRVIAIGSDCPEVGPGILSQALAALDGHDVVIGPAHDGGYYLIGLRAPVPQLFHGIPWSTEAVLEQTLRRAWQLGLRPALLPTLRDVDTASDARALGIVVPGLFALSQREVPHG